MPPITNTMSLAQLVDCFKTASLPTLTQRDGFWRARFVGPLWLRLGGMPSCYISGLWGWLGKKFLTPHRATNVLKRAEKTIDALSMQAQARASSIDGNPVIALTYGSDAPIPWRWVTDELRALDDSTLLGMTRVDLPLIRHFIFPFILERD
ncbi:hypothetical protein [Agitococcus lubricus]|uniref:Uncharacterized protein n=1 Tax=Agitococcus lubricus TaxID=1077255 RepID=A0A2T5IZG8_9GAMM|nr:hypothetical protein [Agitococcus lubricus]PTQ89392.1 hypothetical protein C8N29_107125 [Agitococcus lubricus]